MVSSNHKVLPLGKHKIETPPEYCELFHKGNWEILGNDGNREKLGITGNWETLGIRNWQSRESSGNPAIQGIFRESTGNLAMRGIIGNQGIEGIRQLGNAGI
jgi:hypothetical protein